MVLVHGLKICLICWTCKSVLICSISSPSDGEVPLQILIDPCPDQECSFHTYFAQVFLSGLIQVLMGALNGSFIQSGPWLSAVDRNIPLLPHEGIPSGNLRRSLDKEPA